MNVLLLLTLLSFFLDLTVNCKTTTHLIPAAIAAIRCGPQYSIPWTQIKDPEKEMEKALHACVCFTKPGDPKKTEREKFRTLFSYLPTVARSPGKVLVHVILTANRQQ
jgi:hypothetical protein